MTPIAPGTLCLLLAPHPHAGNTVEVMGPHPWRPFRSAYQIKGRGVPRGINSGGFPWLAERPELLPLAPPGFTDDTPTTIREPEELVR